jgi:hypothetical protein
MDKVQIIDCSNTAPYCQKHSEVNYHDDISLIIMTHPLKSVTPLRLYLKFCTHTSLSVTPGS